MLKSFKYRLYPTPEQEGMINRTMAVCRFAYNLALETKIRAYKDAGVNISVYELLKQFTQLRHEYDWIKEVGAKPPEEAIKNIDLAFKKFFENGGYPKFKSKARGISICIRQCSTRVNFQKGLINAGLIKNIPAKLSRTFSGEIKRVFVSKTPTGKYFASVLVDDSLEVPVPPKRNAAIGIDLGITHFATLSTGHKIENPKYLIGETKRLGVLQRRAARKVKGSSNRRKANLKVALLHEKINNQRGDFLHKISTHIISDSQTDTVCIEDLGIKNIVKNHALARAVSDASWAEFVRQLQYKGEWYGKNVIKVNRFFPSSKTCSNCGYIVDLLPLSMRDWKCPNCLHCHDRDINAAMNIRNSGMGSPGEPVEVSAIAEPKKQESISRGGKPGLKSQYTIKKRS